MAGSPRVVTADVSFTWDGVPWRLQRGQVIDVPPDSDLERAIGANMLTPLGGGGGGEIAPEPEPEPDAEDAQDTQEDAGDDTPQPSARSRRSAPQDTPEAAAETEPDGGQEAAS